MTPSSCLFFNKQIYSCEHKEYSSRLQDPELAISKTTGERRTKKQQSQINSKQKLTAYNGNKPKVATKIRKTRTQKKWATATEQHPTNATLAHQLTGDKLPHRNAPPTTHQSIQTTSKTEKPIDSKSPSASTPQKNQTLELPLT